MADIYGSDFVEEGFLDKPIAELEAFRKKAIESLGATKKEATELKDALSQVHETQASGRKVIDDTEKRVQQLIKAEEAYNKSLDETEKEIVKLKAAQQEQNRINKLTEKLNRSTEGSYDKLSAQYSLNKIELNKMSSEQRKSTKEGQNLEKQTASLYEEMSLLQKATGKYTLDVGKYENASIELNKKLEQQLVILNKIEKEQGKGSNAYKFFAAEVGETKNQISDLNEKAGISNGKLDGINSTIEGLVPSLGGAANGVKALGTQLWALVANPVGAIIAAIVLGLAGLWKAFQQTAGGAAFLEKAMAALGVIFETVLGRLGDFIQGEISFMELLTETGDAIEKNVKASNDLVDARRNLAKATADSELAEANYAKQVAALQAIRDSDAKSLSERQEAARKLAVFEEKEANEVVKRAKLNQDIAQQEFLIARRKGKTSEEARLASIELTKAMAETAQAEAQLIAVRAESANQLEMIRLDIFEQELDLLLDITDRQKSVNERRIADERTTLEEKRKLANENVDIIEDAFAKQIQAFESLNNVQLDEVALLQMTGTEILKYADSLGFSERAVNRLREVVIEKLAADQDNLETLRDIEKQEAEMSKKREEQVKRDLQNLRQEGQERANQLKELALSEIDLLEETEEEKTKLRLEAEKKRLERIIALNKNLGGVLSDVQVQTMKNTIAAINKEIENIETSGTQKSIWDVFGFRSQEDQAAASEAVGTIVDSLNNMAQTRVDAANTAVDSTNRELEAAQQYFEEQKALMEEGEANAFDFAERRLSNAQKNNDKALKERRKAVQAQERLDTIQQVVSLTTASANIFKALSGAGPAGVVLAIGAIAAMFGAFASAKINARKAAQYGDGGEFDITGGSHASGDDVSLGVHGGVERRVEGGEKAAVFSKKAVRRYGKNLSNIIKSLNEGSFEKKFNETFEVDADTREYALNGGSTEAAMLAFWQRENEKSRQHLEKSIKSIPQTKFSMTSRGILETTTVGNTTWKKIKQENSFLK